MSAIKHLDQRVAVFIDAQNLYHTAKHVYNNSKVHFGRVVEAAVAGRSLVRAIAYVISTQSGDEQNFFEALGKLGIEIKSKELQIFIDGSKKADWDVAIAIDAIRIAQRVDCVVLVSGDGDFIPLLQYLKQLGVQTEVVSFGKSISANLREEADIFMDLSEDLDMFLIGNFYKQNNSYNTNGRNNLHQNIKNNFQKKQVKTIKVAHLEESITSPNLPLTKEKNRTSDKEVDDFLKKEENKSRQEIKKPISKEEFFKEKFKPANQRDHFRKKN
jgi:uncharacterized LabA/DUF88 family protein